MATTDTTPDADEQLFAAIGRAITVWGYVEERLFVIYTICAGVVRPWDDDGIWLLDDWVSRHVFYSLETFHAKRTILDAAVEAHVAGVPQQQDLLNEWAALSKKSRELARRRNKLAHWNVRVEADPISKPPRLMPPVGSPLYWAEVGTPRKSLTLIQIGHISKAFRLFDHKLAHFANKLAGVQELSDKDVRQALHLLRYENRLSPSVRAELEQLLASLT